MKKLTLIIILLVFNNKSIGQRIEKIDSEIHYRCSQNLGVSEEKGKYVLTVSYDDKFLKFKGMETHIMTSYSIIKKTTKYIIGKNSDEEYSFYNLKQKKFYAFINYNDYYIVGAYGSASNEFRQTVFKIVDLLKDAKSQKDVVQYLVEQADYEF